MSIVAAVSVSDFFSEAVNDAMRSRGVSASDGAKSYVIGLLSDLAKPGSPIERTLEQPLTLLLNEALTTTEVGERFERLRVLGDGVLYASGFFADHFEARGVDTGYLIGIGRTAYDNAGSIIMSRTGPEHDTNGPVSGASPRSLDIFKELSAQFARFVEVIGEVANATIARGVATSKGLIKLYERWLKTRSDSIGQALSSHGFVTGGGTPRGGILS